MKAHRMKKTLLSCLTALLSATVACPAVFADELVVAVAANFTAPMRLIAQGFEAESSHKLLLSFGSTGKFYAQIRNGAPFDVFLSADDTTTLRLEKDALAVPGSRFIYATGRLVLWSAQPDLVDGSAAVLKSESFRHLAIAAPKLAPYGAAAMQTMQCLGLLSSLQARLVQGESIGQAYSFVASGNAELGFIAMSQVYQAGKLTNGSAWIVPSKLHKPIVQEAALLTRAKDSRAAAEFLSYLKSPPAKAVMQSFGYQ
jgi:molybdate transport system substrate-binding protein